MKALQEVPVGVQVLHELKLHVGASYLRVYEYVTICPECRGGGASMVTGRPLAKLPKSPQNLEVLVSLYPTLDTSTYAAAA